LQTEATELDGSSRIVVELVMPATVLDKTTAALPPTKTVDGRYPAFCMELHLTPTYMFAVSSAEAEATELPIEAKSLPVKTGLLSKLPGPGHPHFE
jgi:hypothetical protein